MTGQVKEEILTRLGEMGLFIEDGKVTFDPLLLRKEELLKEPQEFKLHRCRRASSDTRTVRPDLWPILFVRRRWCIVLRR